MATAFGQFYGFASLVASVISALLSIGFLLKNDRDTACRLLAFGAVAIFANVPFGPTSMPFWFLVPWIIVQVALSVLVVITPEGVDVLRNGPIDRLRVQLEEERSGSN